MFIKICGIKTPNELKIIEKYGDFTGVILECVSKRKIGVESAKNLIEISNIPVFAVSTTTEVLAWKNIIELTGTNYLQMHSNIDSKSVEAIKKEYGCFIMKSFKIPEKSEFPEIDAENIILDIERYEVDRILLDTGKGCGMVHDHRISQIIAKKFDIVLAGGLNTDNVSEIIKKVKPFGVDVSSGVENKNSKDEGLIKKFYENVKSVKL
ncbi:Phosphoribosylanthranilate isomerase [Methanococcus vannielii SB]|uniref:N-(5'-phosphoribosyl)anthranilate isomerase n=1 Tax=Methanococcus vannielii (strain ATCC 35089 / DSM 1224 / JCM 13029 / OCM 148 / SB) TaxID=406327 RepID=TRPF_METVS|nr:phosphoribosylanthranilate isomerase [Methanococcus vannielii]A6UP16.1 RecName: Full=N-(5'-phosphoribosyl)anthranilate isomerase; Short=PRAI [Methanococcus vannielii SB]ABR54238.1 Phosphoribosylanthranilate isomerase [Methanococcus vannielii SB]